MFMDVGFLLNLSLASFSLKSSRHVVEAMAVTVQVHGAGLSISSVRDPCALNSLGFSSGNDGDGLADQHFVTQEPEVHKRFKSLKKKEPSAFTSKLRKRIFIYGVSFLAPL